MGNGGPGGEREGKERRVGVLGVTETAFGVLVGALHPHATVEAIDFADTLWSRLQCLEVGRLLAARFTLGSLVDGVREWAARLAEHCRRRGYDLVIPVNDTAVELGKLARTLGSLPLALPEDRVARHAHDKLLLLREARAIGLTTPEFELVRSPAELEGRLDGIRLPAFFKPIHTALVRDDRLLKFGVRRVVSEDQLVDVGRELLPSVPAMLQREYPGFGIGYTFLAHDGFPLVEAFHRRLHEPLQGEGGSSYRMTIPPPSEELLAQCRGLLKRIRWSGVGMLEFRHDPAAGAYYLMELNGRFWGSLSLHLAAGCDFPRYLLEYSLEGRRLFASPTRVPLRARNLQRDVAWLGRRLGSRALTLRQRVLLLGHWCAEWRHLLGGREAIDFLHTRHLDVFALHLATPLVEHAARACEKVLRVVRGAAFSLRKGAGRRRLGRLVAGRDPARLLLVCHGNINRSAFGVGYARAAAPEAEWDSAGLHPLPSRRSPVGAERVARDHGVDLRGHASKVLCASQVSEADVVLVFDARDHREVGRRFPVARERIVPLGAFDSWGTSGVVDDPGGRSEKTYRRVFAKIRRSVDGLRPELRAAAAESGRARYVIRLDDCHPRMQRANFERIRAMCARFGVRPLAGLIPECRHPDLMRAEAFAGFWDEMRELKGRGWTMALHGYTHERRSRDGGVLHVNRSSEFAGRPYAEQHERLKLGQERLEELQLGTRVFMAPWHSFDWNTVRALKALGFEAITDGYGAMPCEKGGLVWVPQQLGTPRRVPFGVWTFALHSDGMKEHDFRRLEGFLERNASQVVPFEEAMRFRLHGPERLAGAAVVGLLRMYRRARLARAALAS